VEIWVLLEPFPEALIRSLSSDHQALGREGKIPLEITGLLRAGVSVVSQAGASVAFLSVRWRTHEGHESITAGL